MSGAGLARRAITQLARSSAVQGWSGRAGASLTAPLYATHLASPPVVSPASPFAGLQLRWVHEMPPAQSHMTLVDKHLLLDTLGLVREGRHNCRAGATRIQPGPCVLGPLHAHCRCPPGADAAL